MESTLFLPRKASMENSVREYTGFGCWFWVGNLGGRPGALRRKGLLKVLQESVFVETALKDDVVHQHLKAIPGPYMLRLRLSDVSCTIFRHSCLGLRHVSVTGCSGGWRSGQDGGNRFIDQTRNTKHRNPKPHPSP